MMKPFWPRKSPHFALLRAAVRPFVTQPVAVGLSGGPDSLALAAAVAAEAAAQARQRGDEDLLAPLALCVDHQLQEGSAQVAQAAAEQARQWGMEAQVISVDAGQGEAGARKARYGAMAHCGRPVLIAHTAEDQAETLVLGALRGQVAAMSTHSVVEGCHVVRPLLHLRRADTVGACRELGVEPWQDPHNSAQEYRRVRVRHEVMPLLAEIIGGDAVAPIAQAAADAAADNAFLSSLVPAGIDGQVLNCADVAGLDPVVQRRVLHSWLLAQGVEPTRAAVEGIGQLCTSWHGQGPVAVKALTSGGERLAVHRQGGKLALLPGTPPVIP